jgi:hypothetical protein
MSIRTIWATTVAAIAIAGTVIAVKGAVGSDVAPAPHVPGSLSRAAQRPVAAAPHLFPQVGVNYVY